MNIDTASSGGPGNHKELKITGLRDPAGFKKLVWAMKRHNNAANGGLGLSQHQPILAESMHRGHGDGNSKPDQTSPPQEGESISLLLREIRDELRELRKSSHVGGSTVEAAAEMVNMVATASTTSAADNNHQGPSSDGDASSVTTQNIV